METITTYGAKLHDSSRSKRAGGQGELGDRGLEHNKKDRWVEDRKNEEHVLFSACEYLHPFRGKILPPAHLIHGHQGRSEEQTQADMNEIRYTDGA